MADAVGAISAVLTLTLFALSSGQTLYKAFKEFPSHPRQVRDLLTELAALNVLLEKLSQLGELDLGVDLTALRLTLEQCAESCNDATKELQKYCQRSTKDRTSFRDWAKLKCSSGDGIEGFRQQLIGYKATVTVALTCATLYVYHSLFSRAQLTRNFRHNSTATEEAVRECREAIDTAATDLDAHLQSVHIKLDMLSQRGDPTSDPAVRARMEAELVSTEKGIEFCAELSRAIEKVQIDFFGQDPSPMSSPGASPWPAALFGEGLDGCLHHMRFTLLQLENHKKRLSKSITSSPTIPLSAEDQAKSKQLLNEANMLRQCLAFCTDVDGVLETQISNIENDADGEDIIQWNVSTNGQPIHGKNRGKGKILKQIGGYFSDESVQKISGDLVVITSHEKDRKRSFTTQATVSEAKVKESSELDASFGGRHGTGFSLGQDNPPIAGFKRSGR